jgi:hypothetical protein
MMHAVCRTQHDAWRSHAWGRVTQAIVDKLAMTEQRARLLRVAGDLPASEAAYRQLLVVNPDNYLYHDGLRQVG